MAQEIGIIIYQARRAERISRKQLSAWSGVSASAIERYENGTICPTVDSAEKILNTLGLGFEIKEVAHEKIKA